MGHKRTVLVADDSPLIRKILFQALAQEFIVLEVNNGLDAIHLLQKQAPSIDVLLLDLMMPKADGFQVLRNLQKANMLDYLPVIVITAEESASLIAEAYDMGVSEVIQKPFNPDIVKRRVKNICELYVHKKKLESLVQKQTESIKRQAETLRQTNENLIDALSTVIEYRSLESGQHIKRIREFTKILLEHMNGKYHDYSFSEQQIEMISKASALHDVGKIAIPDSVLLKPGKLTAQEFEIMQTHTQKGSEILMRLHGIEDKEYLACCREICLYHHERWDGGGYPEGLSGNKIPIAAQIVSIADVFDALTHKRVYKAPYSIDKSAEMILCGECGTFSPLLLDCFIHTLPNFKELSITYSDVS